MNFVKGSAVISAAFLFTKAVLFPVGAIGENVVADVIVRFLFPDNMVVKAYLPLEINFVFPGIYGNQGFVTANYLR